MNLQAKFALYNAITKIAIVLVLGAIILLSIEKISTFHLDSRLSKKKFEVIKSMNDRSIDSLLRQKQTFIDYSILKDEFIVLNPLPTIKNLDTAIQYATENREIEGDVEIYRVLNAKFIYKGKPYQLEIGETMTTMETVRNTIRFYMLVVLILSLLITLITDYAFTNFILRPFYKIIDQKINKVNDPIAYNYQNIPTNTKDFKILDESVNSLMRKISNLFLLEKQFIANVSHELLTPISILSVRLENMLAAEDLPIAHEHKIFASLKTLNRLKVIINSLLLISKIENDQYLKNDRIDLKEELNDIYEELEDRILDKRIDYKNLITEGYSVKGNKALIHTLLINVINNAIKYNRDGGEIVIKEIIEYNRYQLVIEDNGIGMDEEIAKKAFKRFERENNDNEDGFGLGLAIVSSIAKFHNLPIDIVGKKDHGTVFTISFDKN